MSEKGEECCGACAGQSNQVVLFDRKLQKIGVVQVPAYRVKGIHGSVQPNEDLFAVGAFEGSSFDIYVISKHQKQILQTLKGHDGSVLDLLVLECCKRAGGVLASCSCGTTKAVLLWSLSTGEVLRGFSHPESCLSLCELPWKQWLCCPIYDQYVQFVDVETLKEVHRFNKVDYLDFCQHQVSVCQEKNLICCGNDSEANLCSFYDLNSGQQIAKIPLNSRSHSKSNAFSEICHSFVVEDTTGLMCIFDIRNLTTCVREFKPAAITSGGFGLRCVGGNEFLSSHDKGVDHFNVEGKIISNNASIGFKCYSVTGFATREDGVLFGDPVGVLPAEIQRLSDALSGDCQDFFHSTLLKLGEQVPPISVPSCLLGSSPRVSSEDSYSNPFLEIADVNNPSMIDQLTLVKILTGQPVDIHPRALLSYYNLFMSLGMRKHGYAICLHLLKEIKDPHCVVGIALDCWEHYREKNLLDVTKSQEALRDRVWDECETGDAAMESAESWEYVHEMTSGFSHAAMVHLKYILDDVNDVPVLKAAIHGTLISVFLDRFAPNPLWEHLDFRGLDELRPFDPCFSELAKENLSTLWGKKSLSDVSVVAIDDSEDQEPRHAHLYVLYWKSEFFSQVIRFAGGVSKDYDCQKRVIYVKNLSSGALDALLEFVYTGEISCSDLSDLLSLMMHCKVYCFDTEIQKCVFSRFKEVISDSARSGRLEDLLFDVGYLFHKARVELNEVLDWLVRSGQILKERLDVLIEQGVSEKRKRKREIHEARDSFLSCSEEEEEEECRRKRRKLNPLSDK